MNAQEFEIKRLRSIIDKLNDDKKNLQDKAEYLDATSQEKNETIKQLKEELDKAKKATASSSAVLIEVEDLKNKLEEQDKLVIKKDDELARAIKEHDEAIFKLKNDFEIECLTSQNTLDDQKRETGEWKQELETCQELLKSKEKEISNLVAQSQKLRYQADADVNLLKTCLAEQLDKGKEEARNFKTEIEDLKEQLNFAEETNETLASKFDFQKNLLKQLGEEHERKISENKSEVSQLKDALSKVEGCNAQKEETIKELESTIKENRNFLYTDSELDLALAKIKMLRSENKNLKLENLKLLEDNDQLTEDIVCLRKDIQDSEREHDASDLVRENKILRDINESLEEEKEGLLRELASKSYNYK